MAWTAGGHPLERKKTASDKPVVMLEFAPGFADPNWCERSHVIFVLDGTLEIELEDHSERFASGECCFLDQGTRHRARNPAEQPVHAFVLSDFALARAATHSFEEHTREVR